MHGNYFSFLNKSGSSAKQYRELLRDLAAVFVWLALLRDTNGYFAPYLVVALAALLCSVLRCGTSAEGASALAGKHPGRISVPVTAGILSLAAAAANYPVFTEPSVAGNVGEVTASVYGAVTFLLCLCCGFRLFRSILRYAADPRSGLEQLLFPEKRTCGTRAFLISASVIAAADLLIFCTGKYPGLLTEDSISQIEQLLSGVYSNHHPYYHTLVIKGCMELGFALFGENNINAAVAVYSVFQILVMACTFGYVIATLFRMGLSRKLTAAVTAAYVLLPFHYMYSMTMWKDVLFSAAVTQFLVTAFRMLRGIGRRGAGTWILLAISGIVSCLFRTNGWMTFAAAFPVFCLLFFHKNKKLCGVYLGILAVSFLLKNPVLDAVGVSRTDTIESLSIPAQQIARVIRDCKDELTPEQRELLDQVIDVDHVSLWYSEFISNPVKDLVRLTGDQEYLREHAKEYLRLYIDLGMAHPKQYFEAWVEETKGYWNGGYNYWSIADRVEKNEFGIFRTAAAPVFSALADQYRYFFQDSELLCPLQSIGLHVWAVLIAMVTAFVKGRREAGFLSVPMILYVLSLLAATPVFAEFRYTYVIFCLFPFLIFTPFYDEV